MNTQGYPIACMGHPGSSVGAPVTLDKTSNIMEWGGGVTQAQEADPKGRRKAFGVSLFRGTSSGRYTANAIDVENRNKEWGG